MELKEYSLNEEDYKFSEYEQYLQYIENGFHKLSVKEIKKFNAVSNKLLTPHGKLKKKYTNKDACEILEKFVMMLVLMITMFIKEEYNGMDLQR